MLINSLLHLDFFEVTIGDNNLAIEDYYPIGDDNFAIVVGVVAIDDYSPNLVIDFFVADFAFDDSR
jgi:hypothetical protein